MTTISQDMHSEAGPVRAGLPIYQALLECGYRGIRSLAPGVEAAIWREIDVLHARGGSDEEIRILEQVSLELQSLRQRLVETGEDEDADIEPRLRIRELKNEWLGIAALRH